MLRSLVVLALAFAAAHAQSITPAALKAHVSFLASDALEGRGVGSKGLEIAGEYIASQFRRAGLKPVADDYLQYGDFKLVSAVTEGASVSFEAAGQTHTTTAISILNPAAKDLNGVPAVVVNPKQLESLQAEDLRGKALIVEVSAPAAPGSNFNPIVAGYVKKLQPAAVVILRNGGRTLSAQPRLTRASSTAGPPAIQISDEALYKAVTSAAADVKVSMHLPPPVERPLRLRNVIGVLQGSDPTLRESYIAVSAHYDHLGVRDNQSADKIFNGAIDDASGTASMLEIAHALSALPERPRRSVAFLAFTAEEGGMVGSRFYAEEPVLPMSQTIANINLEHTARQSGAKGDLALFMTGFGYTNIKDYFSSSDLKPTDSKESEPFFTRSDNIVFAEAGVPSTSLCAVFLFPDYHQPGDEWQKVDYEGMASVTNAILQGILTLANSTDAPQWNTANPKTAPYVKARGPK